MNHAIRVGMVALLAVAGLALGATAASAGDPSQWGQGLSGATEYGVSSTESTAPQTLSDAPVDSGASLLKKGSFDIT
ncbi:hypothetical protein QFZ76_000315 [Streptomyces sp. V4I2]|nr:hypothetical protein [Streptomyces sp. V4I2]